MSNVGVIGSGKVGRALGSWIAKSGCLVAFNSRNLVHAEEAAKNAGHGAKALTLSELAQQSDVILLTLPFKETYNVLQSVEQELKNKIVVDVTNPISDDRKSLVIGHENSGAEQIARKIPSSHVVKAFNTVFAEVYASQNPNIAGHRVSICYAGDDASAKARVREIIEKLGFDAVDAGPLINARYLEPFSFLNIQLGRVLGYGTNIGFSLLR